MSTEIRNKSSMLRRDLRRQQLEEYFNYRRLRLIKMQRDNEVNSFVKEHTSKNDVQGLYNYLYKDLADKKISSLSEENCISLFQMLANNISQLESILLLHSIIDMQYRLLFLDRKRQEFNKNFVHLLYSQVEREIQQILKRGNEIKDKEKNIIISGYLNCIRSLQYQALEENDGYHFVEVYRPELVKILWSNMHLFNKNAICLSILSLMECEISLSKMPEYQNYFLNNRELLQKLIDQVDPQKHKPALTVPSLLLVNSILPALPGNKDFITTLLPIYLSKVKVVYSLAQQGTKKPLFHINNFVTMLSNINMFFQILQSEFLQIHLGEEMSRSNLWTLFWLILRLQTQQMRQLVFSILKSTVKNMLTNKAKLQIYLFESFITFLIEGIQSKYTEIIIESLQILQAIIHYSLQNEEAKFNQWILENRIEESLENLQFHDKKGISSLAHQLIRLLGLGQDRRMIQQ